MSKIRLIFTLFLVSLLLFLVGWTLSEDSITNNSSENDSNSTNSIAYLALNTASRIYDENGKLQYQLTAKKVEHLPTTEVSYFKNPELVIYDASGIEDWSLISDTATIDAQEKLQLSNNVVLSRLEAQSMLQTLKTVAAVIDLESFDISSNDQVNIIGDNFTSDGIGLTGNLKLETAELIKNAKTQYFQSPKI